MMRAMEVTVVLELVAPGSLESFLDELTAALAKRGVSLDEVCRITTSEPERVVMEWRSADWAPDDVTEIEIRADGDRIRIEHRGFGRQFWSDEDHVGWFADEVAASVLAASAPQRFGDWLTDRAARRPFGIRARRDYKDPSHHRPSFGAVLSALHLTADDVLLEIGCGGGAFLEQALQSGCRGVGIDHSPEMVRAAGELNAEAIAAERLEVVEANAESLPFDANAFTAAAMMQVFFFLPDPALVLAECVRVLRPGGRLAVFTISEKARGTPAAPEPMASRSRFYTDEELARLARDAGFALASVGHPDLEPHARAAGLPEDVVAMFKGDPAGGQLLLARKA
jgi:SAM-dependent methyltransferase